MKVYDCFLFFNEFDLLELRLRTLWDSVDWFVLVESPWTFSGNAKPLHYQDNKGLFDRWNSKIRHVVQEDSMPESGPWKREFAARNVMPRGFGDSDPDDFIFQSDCDEIWNPEYRDIWPEERVVTYGMHHFYYSLNCRRVPEIMWAGTRRTRRKDWITGQALRASQGELADYSGWHFSFLGDAEQARYKMKSFAHTEYSGEKFTEIDKLTEDVAQGRDPIQPGVLYVPQVIDDSFPKPITEDPDRWRKHLRALPS